VLIHYAEVKGSRVEVPADGLLGYYERRRAKPPSVPSRIQGGPAVFGSGMPLGQSANWFGWPATEIILTSVQLVNAPTYAGPQGRSGCRGCRESAGWREPTIPSCGQVKLQV